jgi:class 3 adenylate cyclase
VTLAEKGAADLAVSGFQPVMRAMLFIDISASSRVPEDRVPAFVDQVLRRLVEEVDGLEDAPVYTDSWGDGLFLAFDRAAPAARAATRLRAAFAAIDLDAAGLPESLDIRIGGHYGPVHEGEDPLQKRPTLFGAQVAIAARIEPCAVGARFVSVRRSRPFWPWSRAASSAANTLVVWKSIRLCRNCRSLPCAVSPPTRSWRRCTDAQLVELSRLS